MTDFDESLKREIAWRSQSVYERIHLLNASDMAGDWEGHCNAVPDTLNEWVSEAENQSRADIAHRLDKAGFDLTWLRAVDDNSQFPESLTLPEWVHEIEQLTTYLTRREPTHVCYTEKYVKDGPFVHILSSIVEYANQKLNPETLSRVPNSAVESLHDWLFHDLIELTAEILYTEFRTFLALEHPTVLSIEDSDPNDDIYFEFVENIHTIDGFASLLQTYPVFARWVIVTVNQWVESIKELDSRLDDDWDALREKFGIPQTRSEITDLESVSADNHGNGRLVIEVILTDEQSVMYKPKDIETELLFDEFLSSIEHETDLSFRYKTILLRDDYGWVEKINPAECATEAEAREYYRRAGAILGASYLLYLNDGHYENILANTGYPVFLDVETILTPETTLFNSGDRHPVVEAEIDGGVYWTGLLRQHRERPEIDESPALNGLVRPRVPYSEDSMRNVWENVNTDQMRLYEREQSLETIEEPDNVPSVDGEIKEVEDYFEYVQDGFTTVGLLALTGELSVEESFSDITTRLVLRNTSEYDAVLSSLRSPKTLADGRYITFSIDALIQEGMKADLYAESWAVFESEKTALKRLDIPRFTVDSRTGIVRFDDTTFETLVKTPGYERAVDRFERLSSDQIQKQRDYIQLSCEPNKYMPNPDTRISEGKADSGDVPQPQAFDEFALDIFDEILEASAPGTNCAYTWLTRRRTNDNALEIAPINEEIYEGRTGIAVYAALLYDLLGVQEARDIAVEVTNPTMENVVGRQNEGVDNVGIAGGVASNIYGLTVLGRLLNDERYHQQAERIVEDLSLGAPRDDLSIDVMSGVAGLLLSLLALYEETGAQEALKTARQCGDYLLSERNFTEQRIGQKRAEGRPPLVGFAHGVAGVNYSLLRLYNHTRRRDLLESCRAGIKYETQVFNCDEVNWPDFRRFGPDFTDSWCHGRSGILLSHMGMETIEPEIIDTVVLNRRLPHIGQAIEGHTDQLCCGNAGRIDTLVEASLHTGRSTYHKAATSLMTEVLKARGERGCFELQGHTPRLHNVSLFQGTSGIGYSLLRLQYPERTPNLLLFE